MAALLAYAQISYGKRALARWRRFIERFLGCTIARRILCNTRDGLVSTTNISAYARRSSTVLMPQFLQTLMGYTLKYLNKRTSTMGCFRNHFQITKEIRPTGITTKVVIK